MIMRRILSSLAAVLSLTTAAAAGQQVVLHDAQMDAVTAGAVTGTSGGLTLVPVSGGSTLGPKVFLFSLAETDVTNTSTVMVNVDPVACPTCYLNINSEAFRVQAQFGPTEGVSNSLSFQSH
jgi:hypothetical protein